MLCPDVKVDYSHVKWQDCVRQKIIYLKIKALLVFVGVEGITIFVFQEVKELGIFFFSFFFFTRCFYIKIRTNQCRQRNTKAPAKWKLEVIVVW